MHRRFHTGLILCLVALGACGGKEETVPQTCSDCEARGEGGSYFEQACGTGTWGDLEALSPTIYVDGSANEGGDGSEDAPLTTISAAIDAEAAAGADADRGVIAVAAGIYAESLSLDHSHDGVVLAGRCAALVTLDAGGEDEGVEMKGGHAGMSASLSGLTVTGASKSGMTLTNGTYTLTDLSLRDNVGKGLYLTSAGTVAVVDHLTVSGTVADERGEAYGVVAWTGSELNATNLTLLDNQGIGLFGSGSTLAVSGLRVAGTEELEEEGAGLWLQSEATAEISSARWAANAPDAIHVLSSARLDLGDAEIEGLASPDPDATYNGVVVSQAGSVALRRVSISKTSPYGIFVGDTGVLSVDQVNVTDTTADVEGTCAGVALFDGELDGSALTVARSEVLGISVVDGTATLDGITISEISAISDQIAAVGLLIWGGSGTLRDLDVSAVEGTGVGVVKGAEASLTDCRIHDLPVWDGGNGEGVRASFDSTLEARACTISDVAGVGLALWEGSSVALDAVSILRIGADEHGFMGFGVTDYTSADPDSAPPTLLATDLLISEATTAGLALFETDATLVHSEVSRIQPYEGGVLGYGISIAGTATLLAEDVKISDVYGVGIQVSGGGRATVAQAAIRGVYNAPESQIGVGLSAQQGGQVLASDLVIENTEGPGLVAANHLGAGTLLVCSACAVSGAAFAGALLLDAASLTLDGGTTIEDTVVSDGLGGGVGIFAVNGPASSGVPRLILEDVAVTCSPLAGLYIDGSGTYEVGSCAIEGGWHIDGPEVHPWGDAVFATAESGDELTISLSDNTLYGSAGAGLFLDGSTATLDGNRWEDNTVDLLQQRCEETEAPTGEAASAEWEICPTYGRRVERLEYYLYLTPVAIEGG